MLLFHPFVVLLNLLLIGAGVACLLWLPRGRRFEGLEPRCAACEYIVLGLQTPVCPECGADLARPGAVLTTGRRPPGRIARSIGWTLFCLLAVAVPVSWIWGGYVMPALPMLRTNNELITFSQPKSKGYRSITLKTNTHGWVHPTALDSPPSDMRIELTRADGTIRVLPIDPATLHVPDASSDSAMSSTLDADVLVSWLKASGVSGEPAELHREMEKVVEHVQQRVSQPSIHRVTGSDEFSGVAMTSSGSMRPLPWAAAAPVILSAIVWGIGMLRIILKSSIGPRFTASASPVDG